MITIFHGTSKENAERIMKEGFKTKDVKRNWAVKSKEGFVSFSTAYAPFFAQATKSRDLALIKVCINEKDLYPEDDFIMYMNKKPVYTEQDLAEIDFEESKFLWRASLKYMGNVNAKPEKVKILGVTFFSAKNLVVKCDPVVTPMNFQIFGTYYNELSEWIFAEKPILEFKNPFEDEMKKNEDSS